MIKPLNGYVLFDGQNILIISFILVKEVQYYQGGAVINKVILHALTTLA